MAERPSIQREGGGSIPTSALSLVLARQHDITIQPGVFSFQRAIRERERKRSSRRTLRSLRGCIVGQVETSEARALIRRYEWLGDLGATTSKCFGLWSEEDELLGAIAFGNTIGAAPPFAGAGPARCLSRGACVHWAPRNAASFLIRHATKLSFRADGIGVFVAYADPTAGEIGTVYQAVGWTYLGTTGAHPIWLTPSGRVIRDRSLRLRKRGTVEREAYADNLALSETLAPRNLTEKEALAQGWTKLVDPPKHRYVWAEPGSGVVVPPPLPYPKR